jgi:hypothetical protein
MTKAFRKKATTKLSGFKSWLFDRQHTGLSRRIRGIKE